MKKKYIINKWLIIIIILFVCFIVIPFIFKFKEGLNMKRARNQINANTNNQINMARNNINDNTNIRNTEDIQNTNDKFNEDKKNTNDKFSELEKKIDKKTDEIKGFGDLSSKEIMRTLTSMYGKVEDVSKLMESSPNEDIRTIKDTVLSIPAYNITNKEDVETIIKKQNEIKNNNDEINNKLNTYNEKSVELLNNILGKLVVQNTDIQKIKTKIRVTDE
jgi:hypothetical protein